jgi:hypothetical protein
LFRSTLRIVLWTVFWGAGLVLLKETWTGPFRLLLPVSSPLNAESIVGISFVLLLFCRRQSAGHHDLDGFGSRRQMLFTLLCLAAITAFSYRRTLDAPLLHDAYTHLLEASTETWDDLWKSFTTHPRTGDLFFRPIGYLSYWLDFRWAGADPFRWNLWGVIVHAINTCLVYLIAGEISLKQGAAILPALVFGLHGSRPEAVSFMAARFDLLAVFFALSSLLALLYYLKTSRLWWPAFMALFAVFALLSKESAFCLPLLALCFFPFKPVEYRSRLLQMAGVLSAVCIVVFAYRHWLLGSIGGYQSANGQATIANFNVIRTSKALLFREWATLFFPINWSVGAGVLLKLALLGILANLAALARYSTIRWPRLLAAIGLVIAASLPVQHLLLGGPDLSGARILYLPVFGFTLLCGLAVQACEPKKIQTLLGTGLVLFQFAALQHNLEIWRQVAFLSQKTCAAIGTELATDSRPIQMEDLPATWKGVLFLKHGFPACVFQNSGQPGQRIRIRQEGQRPPDPNVRTFRWNGRTERMEEIPR